MWTERGGARTLSALRSVLETSARLARILCSNTTRSNASSASATPAAIVRYPGYQSFG
jgi:hypothetical protein